MSKLLGTLFEIEEQEKKTNTYNQVVKDDKGHRRFTGAFTGGLKEFDIGFKGTCGSNEGFVPRQFVSSRTNRYKGETQNLSQLMDEDDLGKQVIGENLMTNEIYGTNKQKEQNQQNELEFLVVGKEQKESIGDKILQNLKKQRLEKLKKEINDDKLLEQQNEMQFKTQNRSYQIEEKVQNQDDEEFYQVVDEYGVEQQIKKNDKIDIELIQLRSFQEKINQNFQGLGFKVYENNYQQSLLEKQILERFNQLKKNNSIEQNQEEIEKQKVKNRIYVDLNNDFENESDEMNLIQEIKDIDEIEQDEEHEQIKKKIKVAEYEQNYIHLNQIVVKSDKNFQQIFSNIQTIVVPQNYDAQQRLIEINKRLDAQELLQKDSNFIPEYKKKYDLENRQKALEDKKEILSQIKVKEFQRGKDQEMGADEMKELFDMEPQKLERFRYYCLEKQGKVVGGFHNNFVSYKEQQKELKEFESLYDKYEEQKRQKSLLEIKIKELEKKRDELVNFRQIEKWFPDKLLCKRFSCLPPYTDQEYIQNKRNQDNQEKINQINKKLEENRPLTAEQELQKEKLELIQQKNEIKLYGLPTEFKGDKQSKARFRSAGIQIGEQYKENMEDQLKQNKNSIKENENQKQSQIQQTLEIQNKNNSEDQENEKEDQIQITEQQQNPKIELFKSIFDDDSE